MSPDTPTLDTPPGRLRVDLGERAYDIEVGRDLVRRAGELIAPVLPRPRAVVVTDETVAHHHLKDLTAGLRAADIDIETITLPPGEQSKSFAELERLIDRLLEMKIERTTTLIAFGGGVIGDLVGFAAAVTLRGLPFVQVPTTLLAQVDSSVGGKTGINTKFGKNLVGAFYQPRFVMADMTVLDTLEHRQLLSGYAEIAKYGLIDDADFFTWLEGNARDLLADDMDKRRRAVLTSCAAKARVVAADEREGGQRALLNLGHTFAHALEAETGYSDRLHHGEAVAIGMVMAFDLSAQLGLCPPEDAARAEAHLAAVGLPTDLTTLNATGWSVETLINHMRRDKKVAGGKLTFILARGIGQAFITQDVDEDDLRAMLARWLETRT